MVTTVFSDVALNKSDDLRVLYLHHCSMGLFNTHVLAQLDLVGPGSSAQHSWDSALCYNY